MFCWLRSMACPSPAEGLTLQAAFPRAGVRWLGAGPGQGELLWVVGWQEGGRNQPVLSLPLTVCRAVGLFLAPASIR